MQYSESQEMYLETILMLEEQRGYARRVEIAEQLGYSKPSVTCAIKLLKAKEYITENEHNHIRLTQSGHRKAASVYERHHLITQLLIHMGAEPSVAEENACRIEHVISADLTDTIRKFMNEAVAFG